MPILPQRSEAVPQRAGHGGIIGRIAGCLVAVVVGAAGGGEARAQREPAIQREPAVQGESAAQGELASQEEPGGRRELETDRDSFTFAPTTTGAHTSILEASYSFIDNQGGPAAHSFPELLLRRGVGEKVELRLGFNYEAGGPP